ncbi:uncharacterized protein LOC111306200 [Durio zibethinus]|uniref:Uncharacterized protein LOC111306200 n=1 Tax=Durio zibethinus TaxID=66656 RepID=A0A6P6A4X0_DURZI|nr:uncharacterized protein LOC111306200 [Durio zibethinus]
MELENTVEDQMANSLFLLINKPLSWIVVLAPLITFATFFIFGSLSFLFTSTVLILSTVLFIISKRRPKLVEKSVEEIHKSVQESSLQVEDVLASKRQHESEIYTQQMQASVGEDGACQIHHDYLVRSLDVLSENECLDQLSTTEDSEVEWPFRDNMDQSPDYTDDGSITDEDSLIEISLPEGHYVSHKEDEPNKYSMHPKLPDFIPESIFQQQNLMELLAEFNDMNEEDNLIEIDISMGSIKCSRFEIEA